MWLTTLASLATPQLKNAQLAFDRGTERKQAERRLRRRERSDRCSRIAFRPLLACRASDLRSSPHPSSLSLLTHCQESAITVFTQSAAFDILCDGLNEG